MRVPVLGGNLYLGRHLVEEFAQRGHDVTVFNSHESQLPPGVRRLHGDRRIPGVIGVFSPRRDEFDAAFDNGSIRTQDDLSGLDRLQRHAASLPAARSQHRTLKLTPASYWNDTRQLPSGHLRY